MLDRSGDRIVDMRKLRIAVWVICALPGLLVGLQAVAHALEQSQHCAVGDLKAAVGQRTGELRGALGHPTQRRARVATGLRCDQTLELLLDPWMGL
jgi:hypothetical protein